MDLWDTPANTMGSNYLGYSEQGYFGVVGLTNYTGSGVSYYNEEIIND